MQRLPSITEGEFENACQEFYDRATGASDSRQWLQVANESGALTIKKEYLVDVPHGSGQEALPTGQDEDQLEEEPTEDEDPQVGIMNHPFSQPSVRP